MSSESAEPVRRKSRIRRIGVFFLTFAISLVIGKAFETLSSCENMISAGKWQQRWYTAVSAMAPLSLATGYLRDVLYVADTGEFAVLPAVAAGSQAGPTPLHGCGVLCDQSDPEKAPGTAKATELLLPETAPATESPLVSGHDLLCSSLRSQIRFCPVLTEGYSECIAEMRPLQERFDAECAGWESPTLLREREVGELPPYVPPDEHADRHVGQFIAAPLIGLAMTFARLVEPGGWSYVWAILQLGIGFLVWILVQGHVLAEPKRRGDWPEGFWGWAVGVPVGTVLCASALAFVMKYLMLGGLAAFGWFTCFAAAACVATGVAGACWYFAVKLAEHAAQQSTGA